MTHDKTARGTDLCGKDGNPRLKFLSWVAERRLCDDDDDATLNVFVAVGSRESIKKDMSALWR